MNKVVRLGTSKTRGGRWYSTFCTIEIKDGNLSICGVEGPTVGGNALGGCGQIDMHNPQIERLAPGWTHTKLARFWDIWKRWHLNDMRAECEHQRALGWTYNKNKDTVTKFGRGCCPTCSYPIGSKWLKEELPQEVIDFLQSLPDTDRTPVWV